MDPQVLILAGFVVLAAGSLVLLSFGAGYRIGRLLASAPASSIQGAVDAAATGRGGYVRIDGRIDGHDEFEDAAHRPLVYRRTRIQVRRGGSWRTVDEGVESVPFEIGDGPDAIAVDRGSIGPGLVVLVRESTGRAGDLGERLPAGTPADLPARAMVEQISSIEHATVVGIPSRTPDGTAVMTGDARHPLIITTVDRDEAMRLLAGGDRVRSFLAAALLGAGLLLVVAGLIVAAGQAIL